jgi:hypothetical protein
MEDVLDLYEEPYDRLYPTVCLDEKPVVLHADVQPPIPVEPGHPERVDYEYERRGTRNLFVMVEPLAGWRHVEVTEQRTMQDYAKVVRWLVDEVYPQAEYIRLVQDNLNTHTPASLYETFPPAEARRILQRLEFHYTPKHGSWLNMAEIEIAILERNALSRRLQDEAALRRQVSAVESERNQQRRGIAWQFTRARCARQAGAALSGESMLIGLTRPGVFRGLFPGVQRDSLVYLATQRFCLVLLLFSAVAVLARGVLARLHAEQPAYPIHPPDHEYIHCQDQCQRERADHEPLGQDTQVPLHHVERDHDDRRLVQHIEWQHCFVRLRKSFRVEIEPADATGEDEDDPGPGVHAEQQLKEQGAGSVAGGGYPGLEIASSIHHSFDHETQDTDGERDPSLPADGRGYGGPAEEQVAGHKDGQVGRECCPIVLTRKRGRQAHPNERYGHDDEKDPTGPGAPRSQCVNHTASCCSAQEQEQGQRDQAKDPEKLQKPEVIGIANPWRVPTELDVLKKPGDKLEEGASKGSMVERFKVGL